MIKFLVLLFFAFIRFILDGNEVKTDEKKKRFRINLKPLSDSYEKLYNRILLIFDRADPGEIRTSELIFLSLRNLKTKRTRTYLTVGGMAIGFGAIIFLLSLGYGFERLVVSEVASLNELEQIDVNSSASSPVYFDQKVIEDIKAIENVEDVIPIITSVSKVKFNNSVSDVIVYGVNTKYLDENGFNPLRGQLFEEGEFNTISDTTEDSKIAGASVSLIDKKALIEDISSIKYSIFPEQWKPVYQDPKIGSNILGYTRREPGEQEGFEIWGEFYTASDILNVKDINGERYSAWIKGNFPLWKEVECSLNEIDCFDNMYKIIRDNDSQIIKEGYITEDNVSLTRFDIKTGEVFEGKIVDQVDFNINSESINAYLSPYPDSDKIVINNEENTRYNGEILLGEEYGSSTYVIGDNGVKYNYWVKSDIGIYRDECETCDSYTNKEQEGSKQEKIEVFVKLNDVYILNKEDVLGAETTNDNFVDIESIKQEDDGIDWVSLSEELGTGNKNDIDVLDIPSDAKKIAVVNTSMLNILGLTSDEAIDKEFEATFVFDSILFNKTNYSAESEPVNIKILGVVSDSKSPTFYTPINDLLVEGLINVSQVKVIANDTNNISSIRTIIEAMGFQTKSVVDTVENINSLFDSLRILLLILGLIALSVASLGMFNTLTVSLLEKTREVGLLKTMGLKSHEVKTVFLSESLIMSVLGGLIGLIIAFLGGQIISLLLSILSSSQGMGSLNVSYIPESLTIAIIVISSIVGLITGWYPARRAKKISALYALRYE